MTSVETVDSKVLRSSVDAIAAQIAAHNESVARRNAKCAIEGSTLKLELTTLAREKPRALGDYLERSSDDYFKVLYNRSGHISGYETPGGFLSLFHVEHDDNDLQQYIARFVDKRAELCGSRSR